jgi:hypothetical protein
MKKECSMKNLKSGILVSLAALSLAACSSTPTDQPGAATPTATPVSSNAPAETPAPPKPAAPKMVTVPAATALEVVLDSALSSAKNNAGDKFDASLAAPVIVNGDTVLEKGAKVHGRVVDAKESGRVKGLASITLTLTDVVQGGVATPITTKEWSEQAEATKKRDTGIIGGAAAIGTAIGAIAGGKKGAVEGAAVGGGAGAGTVLATKGKEVELGPEAKLKFTLEKSVELVAAKN